MELHGKKPARDFLSLHTEGSSQLSSRGYDLEMHNFLKPLELPKHHDGDSIARNAMDRAISKQADSVEHALPGGIGTFSIRQATDTPLREEVDSHGKSAFAPVLCGATMESKRKTDTGTRAPAPHHCAPSTMWQDSSIDPRFRDLAVRVEGKSSGSSGDQMPNTPRSKHSATEQRRRTKINDRFQTLRELLPHCDQKRDKASFLLEVIEYIRFLQEKVQKHEPVDPEWSQVHTKSMPWGKVYYRSCWKNTQNISQVLGDGLFTSTQNIKRRLSNANGTAVTPAALFSIESTREIETTTSTSHNTAGTLQNCAKNGMPNNQANQPQWLSMSTVCHDNGGSNAETTKYERAALHDDTHDLSSAYSQGLLARLTQALKKSGVETSQANISVEINIGRRARRHNANTSSSLKASDSEGSTRLTKRFRCDNS